MPKGGQPPRNKRWRETFLRTFDETHMVTEACKKAGVSRAYVYMVRKREDDFREAWEAVEEKSTEILEQIAVQRAANGSDNLIMFLLKSRRPEVYRENVHHEHQHNVEGNLTFHLPDGRQPIQIESTRRREAARMLMEGVEFDLESDDLIPDATVVDEEPPDELEEAV